MSAIKITIDPDTVDTETLQEIIDMLTEMLRRLETQEKP